MADPEPLLIRNALVVTLDAANTVHQAADVLIENGAITAIGSIEGRRASAARRIIDGTGKMLVPGFVNAHTHSPATLIHGTGDRLSHPAHMWMNQAYTANKTPREIYVSAMLGCIQMLLSGTTAALDHFPGQSCTVEDVDAALSAYRDSGMRAVLGVRFYDAEFGDIMPRAGSVPAEVAAEIRRLSPLNPMPLQDVRAVMEGAIARWHGTDGRLAVFPAPSNPERCSDDALLLCRELAERHGLGIHTHLLESRVQADNARRLYGCTMVEHLDRLGLLGPFLSCAHAIWLEPADIERLAASGAVVVHNPESNMKIAAGTAPIPALIARGAGRRWRRHQRQPDHARGVAACDHAPSPGPGRARGLARGERRAHHGDKRRRGWRPTDWAESRPASTPISCSIAWTRRGGCRSTIHKASSCSPRTVARSTW